MDKSYPQKKGNIRYITWILFLASLLLFITNGYPLLKQIVLDTIGVQTTGQVIEVLGNKTKSPVVHFTTEAGQEIEFKSHYATNFISFSAGQEVEVRYLASYPRIAEVSVLGRLNYLTGTGMTCLGGSLFLAALVSMMNKPFVLDLSKKK